MSEQREKQDSGSGKLGFLDSLAHLFRRGEEAAEPESPAASGFEALQASFDAAVVELERKIEESRSAALATGAARPGSRAATSRAAERERRMATAHREILEDIEQIHARLGTELAGADLEELAAQLEALHRESAEGRSSHSLLPRMRWAIAERLCREAGELAVARLVALLEREQMSWPDATQERPSATPDELERSRRRRLDETPESFLGHDLGRTAQRTIGVVSGWKSDYPDRGSLLWQECVLVGVAAGMRGQLVEEAAALLGRDRDRILEQAQASIGKQLETIQQLLAGGVESLEQANRAVASSLRVLDEIVPEIAWQHVREQIPRARGEYGARPAADAG